MLKQDIYQMHFDTTIPVFGIYNARKAAKKFDASIVALLGHRNICMIINKNTNLTEAKREYEDKLKFLTDIECKKQTLNTK